MLEEWKAACFLYGWWNKDGLFQALSGKYQNMRNARTIALPRKACSYIKMFKVSRATNDHTVHQSMCLLSWFKFLSAQVCKISCHRSRTAAFEHAKAGLPADGLASLWQSFNISCCFGKWQSLIGKPSPHLPFFIAIGYVRLRVPFDKPALFNLTWCDIYKICMKSAAELTTCATCRCSRRPYLRRSTGRALLVMLLGTCPNDIGERRL